MAIYIGIEGVGMRRCAAVAADEHGSVIGWAPLDHGLALHAMPRDILQSRLKRLIQLVAKSIGRDLNRLKDATLCIGLTGVTFPYDAEVDLPREIADLHLDIKRLICTGDAEIVMASHIQKDSGAALLCHMGSTAYVAKGLAKANRVRVGGWGPALGDEGSGYWIGRSALRLIGDQYDAGLPYAESILWKAIVDWLKNPDPDISSWNIARLVWRRIQTDYGREGMKDLRPAIFAFAHEISRESQATWRDVASGLVIPVMRAAFDGGDPHALKILTDAVDHLHSQLLLALRLSGTKPGEIPTVLYGGVMTHNRRFRDLMVSKLEHTNGAVLTPHGAGTMRPAYGALLFALGDSTSTDLALPNARVIDHLRKDPLVSRPPAELYND